MMPLRQIRRLTDAGGCVSVCLPGLTRFPFSRRITAVDCPSNHLCLYSLSRRRRISRRRRNS
ncbi:hypothetical protein RHMOL_Rhmol04G0275400 [Rhododendron molle]|uniref:Uncharacterized protein n=1 Tax=Rhododendron molle TaxID=49168 RepID=A0ACC0P698_RHOML|nr:hypothetical protein RHMOL_Rhmol04G0275400 [Rhododendron molle]